MPGAALRRRAERARLAARATITAAAVDLLIESGDQRRGLQHRRRQRRQNVDLTQRILELLGKPQSLIRHVADRPGHDRRYSLDTTKLRALGWTPAGHVRGGPRRDGRVVPARTNGGGGRSRTQTLAFKAYYQAQSRRTATHVTVDRDSSARHRRDRIRRQPPARAAARHASRRRGVVESRRATAGSDRSPRALARGRSARRRAASATRSPSCARRRSITAPGLRTSADRGRHPTRALQRQRARHASPARWRAATPAWTARFSSTGSALVYRPSDGPIDRGLADRADQPVRREQARAGDARAPGARATAIVRTAVQPRRSAAVDRLRHVQLRPADRGDRARAARRRCCGSATSTRAATSPTCATSSAPTGCSLASGQPRRPYNVCSRRRLPGRRPAGQTRRTGTACTSRSKSDAGAAAAERQSRRARRSIAHPRRDRLGAGDSDRTDTRRSARLLAATRRFSAAVMTLSGRLRATRGRRYTSRWARSRCCCRYLTWWQAVLLAARRSPSTASCCLTRWHALYRPASAHGGYSPGSCCIRWRCSSCCSSSRRASTSSRRRGASSPPATAWRRSSARTLGGPRVPWNRDKSVAGSLALFLFGGAAGAFLAWWCRPAVIPAALVCGSYSAVPFAAAAVAAWRRRFPSGWTTT